MFLNIKGDGAKTAADIGYAPQGGLLGSWLVAGLFNRMLVRHAHECDVLVLTIGALFGADAVATLSPASKTGQPVAVVVRPDARIVARLDDELDRFDPDATRRDESYEAFVAPYIEDYWRDLGLSGRIKMVNEAEADPSCVMEECCPDAVRGLVEILVTTRN